MSKAARIIALVSAHDAASTRDSPREFLLAAKADSYPEKIAVLGEYASDRNGTRMFSSQELIGVFREAGARLPKNLGRDITAAIALGFIARGNVRGMYRVTDLGKACVESAFSDSQRLTRSKGSRAGLSERVETLEIEPHLEGCPDYWDSFLKSNKSVRILWLLEFCNAHGIPELSAADLSHLAKRLGDEIKINTIPSKMRGLEKKEYVIKTSSGRFRMLPQGSSNLRGAHA